MSITLIIIAMFLTSGAAVRLGGEVVNKEINVFNFCWAVLEMCALAYLFSLLG